MTPEQSQKCLCEWDAQGLCKHCQGSNNGLVDLYRYCDTRCPGIWQSFVEPQPQPESGPIKLPEIALGNAVERMLSAMGITKERVMAWTRTKDCGCPARQQWLNRWGDAQREKVERVLNKAARFYFGK